MIAYFGFTALLVFQLVLLAQATDLVGGHGGRMGIASVFFAAVGGYQYAILTTTEGLNPWLSIFFVLVFGGVLGCFIGWLFGHLSGNSFLLATLALQMGFIEFANNVGALGGPLGIRSIPSPLMTGQSIDPVLGALCVLVPGVAISTTILGLMLGKGKRIGLIIHWIRDDELLAKAFGFRVEAVKITLLIICGICSALTGIGIVVAQNYVSPGTFDLGLSLSVLTVVYLSGTGGSPWAMFAGSALVIVTNEILLSFGRVPEMIGPIQQIILNLVLIGVLLIRRRGIAGPVIETGPSASRSQ